MTSNQPNALTTGDRKFAPTRKARCALSESIAAEALQRLLDYERETGLRRRKRKDKDQARFASTVSAVTLDLVHREKTSPGGGISVSQSNDALGSANRYKPAALNTKLPYVLDHLQTLGVLTMEKGFRSPSRGAKLTTCWAGPWLIEAIKARGVTLSDVATAAPVEVIELRGPKPSRKKKGKALPYTDTAQTIRWRREMEEINEWLEQADLVFDAFDDTGRPVDTSNRSLTRIFNETFERGGRLYGGFWQDLGHERRSWLRIDGQQVVELDLSQCGPRILYSRLGATPPDDSYAVPGLEGSREGCKKVFNSLCASGTGLTNFPDDSRHLFPEGMKFAQVKGAILQHHATIAPAITKGTAHAMMLAESEMLVDLLLSLKSRSIVALPIHDGILVGQHRQQEAREAMEAVFTKHTGLPAIVKVKGR